MAAKGSAEYDLFISYGHGDRRLVAQMARELKRRHIRVWWDVWEMSPGDILRERINEGVEAAASYLVVVSPSTLASPWVQHELNAAFIRSIEDREVRLIAAITGEMSFADLPVDLRSRYGLDLRTPEAIKQSIDKLIDMQRPELRKRKELLARLRRPDRSNLSVDELTKYALAGDDQPIQIAAMRGLGRTPGPGAVCACASRSLNPWGMGAIEVAIQMLGRMPEHGGLLALSATCLNDSRFVRSRLDAMRNAAEGLASTDALESIEQAKARHGFHFEVSSWAEDFLDALAQSNDPDVRIGAVFMRTTGAVYAGWLRSVRAGTGAKADEQGRYFEQRAPGLLNALLNAL